MTNSGWDIRRVYFYLVSFTTLIMIIVGTSMFIRSLVDVVMPPPLYKPTIVDYKMRVSDLQKGSQLTKAEAEKMVQEEYTRQEIEQKRGRIRSLLNSISLLVVATPIYLYHWRWVVKTETGH